MLADAGWAEALSDALLQAGAWSVSVEDAADLQRDEQPIFAEPGEEPAVHEPLPPVPVPLWPLNRLRVRRLARAGKPSAKLLNGFLEKPEKFLWTILVGNTLANFLILGFTLAKIHEWFVGNTILIVTIFAAVVFLFYAFFDLLPGAEKEDLEKFGD